MQAMSRIKARRIAWSVVAVTASLFLHSCAWHSSAALRGFPDPPKLGKQIERAARALTGNALLGLLASDDISNRLKEAYNRAAPADGPQFVSELEHGLALYDGFDGVRGNQWLAGGVGTASTRYRALAMLLADDRLWVNSASTTCSRYLAVELDALATPPGRNDDCGGRTPNEDAVDVFRSLLVNGTTTGVADGVASDDHVHSTSVFPFLAPP
jgi:hypothetical protein